MCTAGGKFIWRQGWDYSRAVSSETNTWTSEDQKAKNCCTVALKGVCVTVLPFNGSASQLCLERGLHQRIASKEVCIRELPQKRSASLETLLPDKGLRQCCLERGLHLNTVALRRVCVKELPRQRSASLETLLPCKGVCIIELKEDTVKEEKEMTITSKLLQRLRGTLVIILGEAMMVSAKMKKTKRMNHKKNPNGKEVEY